MRRISRHCRKEWRETHPIIGYGEWEQNVANGEKPW